MFSSPENVLLKVWKKLMSRNDRVRAFIRLENVGLAKYAVKLLATRWEIV
jgi:hypothetical protein